jgi:hypothetical protein
VFFHGIFLATLVALGLHLWRTRRAGWQLSRVAELSLLYLLAGLWGVGGVLGALPHILAPDYVARYVGWPTGGAFQVELGFASLGMSVLGILCIWLRGWFWLSPIVSKSIFLLGAAYLHIEDIFANDNLNPGNAGPVLFYDLAIPVLSCALFVVYVKTGGLEPRDTRSGSHPA